MTITYPFDEVRIVAPPPETMTPAEFFALPLAKRVRHVLTKTAVFLRGGEVVDAADALAQLRADRVAS